MPPLNSGNRLTKGNCCGGYNRYNEDYVWSMLENGYPRFQVNDVVPYTINTEDEFNGVFTDTSKCVMLFGTFWFFNGTHVLSSLQSDGMVVTEGLSFGTFDGLVCRVQKGEAATGFFFHGWKIDMNVNYFTEGIQVGFQQWLGGSYPSLNPLTPFYELTPLTSYFSKDDTSVTLNAGITSLEVTLKIAKLSLDDAGIYETYSTNEIGKLIKTENCDCVVVGYDNGLDTDQYCTVTLSITNIQVNATVKYWYDVSVLLDTDLQRTITGLSITLSDGTLVPPVLDCPSDTINQIYIRGLAFVKAGNLLTVAILDNNLGAVDQAIFNVYDWNGANTYTLPVNSGNTGSVSQDIALIGLLSTGNPTTEIYPFAHFEFKGIPA